MRRLLVVVVRAVHDDDGTRGQAQQVQNLGVVASSFGDQYKGGHVVIVVQQDVRFDTALGAPKRRPGKLAQAQGHRRRIQRQLTEKHVGELRPAGEALRVAFGVMLGDQLGEFIAWNLVKQLTEETGCPYHFFVFRVSVMNHVLMNDSFTPPEDSVKLTFRAAI